MSRLKKFTPLVLLMSISLLVISVPAFAANGKNIYEQPWQKQVRELEEKQKKLEAQKTGQSSDKQTQQKSKKSEDQQTGAGTEKQPQQKSTDQSDSERKQSSQQPDGQSASESERHGSDKPHGGDKQHKSDKYHGDMNHESDKKAQQYGTDNEQEKPLSPNHHQSDYGSNKESDDEVDDQDARDHTDAMHNGGDERSDAGKSEKKQSPHQPDGQSASESERHGSDKPHGGDKQHKSDKYHGDMNHESDKKAQQYGTDNEQEKPLSPNHHQSDYGSNKESDDEVDDQDTRDHTDAMHNGSDEKSDAGKGKRTPLAEDPHEPHDDQDSRDHTDAMH